MGRNSFYDSRRTTKGHPRPQSILLGVIGAVVAGSVAAQQEDGPPRSFRDRFVEQVVTGSELTGELGVFDFRRVHDNNRPYPSIDDPNSDFDTRSNAFGGSMGVETGIFYGFSAQFGISFAEPIVSYENPNENLVGPDEGLYAIPQGYLQYNRPGLRVRGGRQLINTPFANKDQFALIPRSFSGASVAVRPLEWGSERAAPSDYTINQYMPFEFDATVSGQPTWQIFIARMTRYQSRFNDEFTDGNRYLEDTPGLFTVGTTFRSNTADGDYIGQIWHYTFFDTASLQYAEVGYQMPAVTDAAGSGGFEPYVRMQYARGEEAGRARMGEIDADIYGLKIGVQSRKISAALVGHYSPLNEGTFRDGQLVHPYSDLSGVFYTDTMNNGVDGLGPGSGLGGQLDVTFTRNIEIFTRYVYYEAKRGQSHAFYNFEGDRGFAAGIPIVEDQNSWGWDTGITVNLGVFSAHLEGLKLENVLGITDFDGAERFYNNRLRVLYQF